jgi:proteasome lid subunit RPN8/RPN11
MEIRLSKDLRAKILAHLQSTYPNEGGGFLFGAYDEQGATLVDYSPVQNSFEEAEQFHRYAMTPLEYAKHEDAADERGLTLLGWYHSHPNSPALPSEYDLNAAVQGTGINFLWLIAQINNAQAADLRAYQLRPNKDGFNELRLVET